MILTPEPPCTVHDDSKNSRTSERLSSGQNTKWSPVASQVPDSDNDESLEELAIQQEQQYWTLLAGAEAGSPLLLTALSSTAASQASVASTSADRSYQLHATPVVANRDRSHSLSDSPLPSLENAFGPRNSRLKGQRTNNKSFGTDRLGRHASPSASPDPMLLQSRHNVPKSKGILDAIQGTNLAGDEGYQTRTDSDHVPVLEDVSIEQTSFSAIWSPRLFSSQRSKQLSTPSSSDSSGLPPPLSVKTRRHTLDRVRQGSPASSSSSDEPPSSPAIQVARSRSRQSSPKSANVSAADSPSSKPVESNGHSLLADAAPVRQFRQRKPVQLAPYSTEFTKFASIATKNSWEGIVSAGLRQAFIEREAQNAEPSSRKRTATDDWLVQEEDEAESGYSEPDPEEVSRDRREDEDGVRKPLRPVQPNANSVERYSRTHKEREWDPIANRLKASTKTPLHKAVARGAESASHRASSSRITLEDYDEKRAHSRKRKLHEHAQARARQPKSNTTVQPGPSRSKQTARARESGLLPSDVDSSSSEHEHRGSRFTSGSNTLRHVKQHRRDHAESRRRDAVTRIDSDSDTGSSSSSIVRGDDGESPERPLAPTKDRYTLKGKRRRAAMTMMPAVAFKRAQADLKLMEQEIDEGKQLRLEYDDNDGSQETAENAAARAKTRWAPKNANRPFRYVTELSSDSDSDVEYVATERENGDEETQAAMQAWTAVAAGRKPQQPSSRESVTSSDWNNVIGRILSRSTHERQLGRSRKTPSDTKSALTREKSKKNSKPCSKPRIDKQSSLRQHFLPPVYLDSTDRLSDCISVKPTHFRTSRHRQEDRRIFWDAIMQDTTRIEEAAPTVRAPVVPYAVPAVEPVTPANVVQFGDAESFRYARFSCDFDLQRLPSGRILAASTYLRSGLLKSLLQQLQNAQVRSDAPCTVAPFGISLDSDMDPDVLLEMLPRIVEHIFQDITNDTPCTHLMHAAGQAIHFVATYTTRLLHREIDTNRGRALLKQLLDLEERLEEFAVEKAEVSAGLIDNMISFKWHMLALAIESYGVKETFTNLVQRETARQVITEGFITLVGLLLDSGLSSVSKVLTELLSSTLDEHDCDSTVARPLSTEVWVSILHLSFAGEKSTKFGFLNSDFIWTVIEQRLNENAMQQKMHPILRGEIAACTCMTLCALSQFSELGEIQLLPRLKAFWPILHCAVDSINIAEITQSFATLPSTSRTRLSRYIWTFFSRSLIMCTRWNWQIRDQGKLIGKLFDILNARQLEDFSIDGEADFPAFVTAFDGQIAGDLDKEDTAFHIFLRLLAQVGRECNEEGTPKAKAALARMAMRIMPMREQLPYPRQSDHTNRLHRSVLVNHCALFITLAAVDPSTSERRFAKLKTILNFEDSDVRARQDYLKAIMYLGIVYRKKALPTAPILSWLTHTANYLRETYGKCARRRVTLQGHLKKAATFQQPVNGSRGDVSKKEQIEQAIAGAEQELTVVTGQMGETAVMEALLLGAVTNIMIVQPEVELESKYPSLGFLDKAWTSDVLTSSMARDPVVGSQLLRCLREYLNIRLGVVDKHVPEANGESQDEYADMDIDWNDPSLNAMLGIPQESDNSVVRTTGEVDVDKLDQDFREVVRSRISSHLYNLLSDLNVSSAGLASGVPEFPNKHMYIVQLTETWACCAGILVKAKVRDWQYYIGTFGKESWQRIGDVNGRYEVGVSFSAEMLRCDASAYKPNRDILLEILFRRLAVPALEKHDADFFTCMLEAAPLLLFWQGLPVQRDELIGKYNIATSEMTRHRLSMLRTVFANCKRALAKEIITIDDMERSGAAICREQNIDNSLIYRLLGHLLSSLRDHLDAGKSNTSDKTKHGQSVTQMAYAAFCRQVVSILKQELGPAYASDTTLPQLRLLAGIMSGTE